MKLVVTHGLRLRRKDLARLSDIHRAQFVAAIAPGQAEIAESLIETGAKGDVDDAHGLVYLRFHDEAQPESIFEGWLLDDKRAPSKTTMPDGGLFFFGDTTDSAGVEMSQGGLTLPGDGAKALHDAIADVLPKLRVASTGPAMKQNPPFAHAVAPKPAKVAMETGALRLRVVRARRYIESELRAAPEQTRFQALHAVRPLFATPTPSGMEDFHVLGSVYRIVEPGPEAGPSVFGKNRWGLAHVRFADDADPPREFDGWFWLTDTENPSSYWPSARSTMSEGRIMVGDGIEPTGVEVVKGKVRVSAKRALPVAEALAKGLRKIGLEFDLEVSPLPAPGQRSYFERSRE